LADLNHPDVLVVIAQGMKDIAAAGVAAGTIAFSETDQKRFAGQGGTFLCVEADVTLLQSALQATKSAMNGI
jgi:4-hydroxy-2-oxoheptanedioate aldolase